MKQQRINTSHTSILTAVLVISSTLFLTSCKKVELERQVLLTTDEVSEIAQTKANVTGTMVDFGPVSPSDFGFHWAIKGEEIQPYDTISLGWPNQPFEFTETLWNLEPGTTYKVWTFIQDGSTEYGADPIEFTTPEIGVPVVETWDTLFVGPYGAEIQCHIASDQGSPVIEKGICWGPGPDPTVSGPHNPSETDENIYPGFIDGLMPDEHYFARAYATNSKGTGYGENREFVTKTSPLPMVHTLLLGVGETVVLAGGRVFENDNSTVTETGVLISYSNDPWEELFGATTPAPTDSFAIELHGLSHYTEYWIKAYAISDKGTAFGEPIRLRTLCTCGEVLEDPRDGQLYPTVQIGDQCWMARNMDIGDQVLITEGQHENEFIEKYCYENDPEKCEAYGGWYTWDEAMQYADFESARGICPEGWHIPSDAEWKFLEEQIGVPPGELDTEGWRGTNQGGLLKLEDTPPWNEPNIDADNTLGFSALPAGVANQGATSEGMGEINYIWTSTLNVGGYAYDRRLVNYDGKIGRADRGVGYAVTVRCVRNQ